MAPGVEENQQRTLVVTSAVLTAISTWLVATRLLTRQVIIHSLGKDDLMIVFGWFFTVAYLAEVALLSRYGIGFKSSEISLGQTIDLMKVTLAIEVTYYIIIFCIKTSIVLFYLRLSANEIFRRLCYATILLLSTFSLGCVIITLIQCVPMRKLWDHAGAVDGSCINTTAFFYSTSAFNIITDFWILALPIKPLREMERPRSEKIALYFIFGVGVFACVASIVRLHTISLFTLSKDPLHDGVQVNLWSMIEVNTAVFCASIPALRPLISRSLREHAFEDPECAPAWFGNPCQGRCQQGQQKFSGIAAKVTNDLKSKGGDLKSKAGHEFSKARSLYATLSSIVKRPDRTEKMEKDLDLAQHSSSEEYILYPPPSPDLLDPRIAGGRYSDLKSNWKAVAR